MRRPVELVFYAEFIDINIAIQYEKKIKKWSRAKKEALIKGEYDKLPDLAKKKFDRWHLDTIFYSPTVEQKTTRCDEILYKTHSVSSSGEFEKLVVSRTLLSSKRVSSW